MEIQDINNNILVKQTQIRVEQDPTKKTELNKQLLALQLRKEIENIKMRISQLQNSN